MKAVVVLTTAPSEAVARRLARTLVAERRAACVTVLPGARSVYRWRGRIERASERLLLIKTTVPRRRALVARLKALHPYTLPEILWFPAGGSPDYLAWLRGALRGRP